ncbi:hypothetical protein BRADI_2g03270v3 [Brachypodium distachyon]|uniref:PGG domain-containing protein n=2 Tax=Brachypodium distachyon TaxID=15368 RepID=A0A0Q3FTK4_BRADI|nr:hypothetical protein BRADI_2g03270v3 [Brachypodium distachyon]
MRADLLQDARDGLTRVLGNNAINGPAGQEILLGTTPLGNNCLHIASIHGHEGYCHFAVQLSDYLPLALFTGTNSDGETPLATAVRRGSVDAATTVLLQHYTTLRNNGPAHRREQASQAILRQDNDGCNVLHHAIRRGHREVALRLIALEPALSAHQNNYNESPMFAAAMRDFQDVVVGLLATPGSLDVGPCSKNALHAAVRNGNNVIAGIIVRARPLLATQHDPAGNTPVCQAVRDNMVAVLVTFLEHDPCLAYARRSDGRTLLQVAADQGHVRIAQELLTHCPDAPCRGTNVDRSTCLHIAVENGSVDFVKLILRTPQLGKVVNMQDAGGRTALHIAVFKCNPQIVKALLSHSDIDTTVITNNGNPAVWALMVNQESLETLNGTKVISLINEADRQHVSSINNLKRRMSQHATDMSRNNVMLLTQRYVTNTSLVAILIATITFAAAFTLPGGYNSKGLPNMSGKVAFKAFLVSDILATCSSLGVAFACILARFEDYEYLIYYKAVAKYIMLFAYVMTTIAFSTGLYTVLAPHSHWLAILICVGAASFPIFVSLTFLWPVVKLTYQLGETVDARILNSV